ncbi:hypothetical protein [Halomarina rubra]|uniref:DUF7982 domain-containing protein n=1 Tax=Halomarina rubra TaxID=2071873 RepID=A0ABD6AWJ8_9EURY|nr:hypothetical protein [Halomarina rubra]
MSESVETSPSEMSDEQDQTSLSRAEILAQVETLRAENNRLRTAYRDAQRQRYRRTAAGFGIVGVLALLGAALFPGVRTVLLALGGTGVFAAVMTLYLTPEAFISASVGEAVSQTYSENTSAIVADLGLSDNRVYLPTDDETRLYLPQYEDFDTRKGVSLDTPFVTAENERSRGLALLPTGSSLYDQFEQAHSGPIPERPSSLARALADAAIEQFELADTVDPETENGRLALGVAGARIEPVSALDHPLASLVAVGLATQLGTAIDVTVQAPDDERYDSIVVYTWDSDDFDLME